MRVLSLITALPFVVFFASGGDEVPTSQPRTHAHDDADGHAREHTHVVMERMLTALPPHFQPQPQVQVSPLQPHELVFAVRVRNMDVLRREVLLRATPPPPDQSDEEGAGQKGAEDALYQRWFSYDEVTAFTAAEDSAQAVLAWLAGLANEDEAGTGAVVVTHVSPRHDFIRATAPVGLWQTHLRTVFAAYVHDAPSLSLSPSQSTAALQEALGGSAHAENFAPLAPLVLRAENYSLPAAVAPHVETVFNTVQVPLLRTRARRTRGDSRLAAAADHSAPHIDGDGDGYGEIASEPTSRELRRGPKKGMRVGPHGDAAREVHEDGPSETVAAASAAVSASASAAVTRAVAPGTSAQLRAVEQPDEREQEEEEGGGEEHGDGDGDGDGGGNRGGDTDSLFTDQTNPQPSTRPTRSLRPNHTRAPARSRRPAVAPSTLGSSRVAPRPAAPVGAADSAPLDVTIPFLRNLYRIPRPSSSTPRSSATNARARSADVWRQSVFETNREAFSNADLAAFQRANGLPRQPAVAVGGFQTNTCSLTGSGAGCFEGNLDVQFISGTTAGSGVATEVWHVDADTGDPFLNWILAAAQDPSPPAVTSISWGNDERYTSPSVLAAFEREAVKLAAIGVTILVSSGDNGVAGYDCKKGACGQDSSADSAYWPSAKGSGWTGSGFFPKFPASCPWVTAVGATSGPESGHADVAASSAAGDVITTGGGFSGYWSAPAWQSGAVAAYAQTVGASSGSGSGSGSGFNRRGRGYPDVALIGVGYQVVVQGQQFSMYGTSASTPVFAGMVTLVNGQRARQGRGPVGLLNPTLYAAKNAARFGDVTSGSNNCCSSIQPAAAICCWHGFTATAGWDPLTGLGTLTYPALLAMFT